MKRLAIIPALLLTLCNPLAGDAAPAGASSMLGPIARQFMVAAMPGGHAEVALARLARERGHETQVLAFAQNMMTDHPPINAELLALSSKRMDVGAVPKYSIADQIAMERLAKLSPADFDQQYLLSQIADHLVAIMVFQTEADNGTDPALKKAAKDALPMLQNHLQLAVEAVKHVGGDTPFKS